MIYFDHNATTPIDQRVLDAMLPFLEHFYGNPSSLYRHGRIARTALDNAREQIANLLDAKDVNIVFTSGGTEANHLALTGLSLHGNLAVSAIEHPSLIEPAKRLALADRCLQIIDVDGQGVIKEDAVLELLSFQPEWVSIMLANNETGAIQPVARYADLLKTHGIRIHTDAVQALGKIPVSFSQLGVDAMTLSSHKIYGPKGCGALVFKKDAAIQPLLQGGGQESGFRAGTENVAAIVGFGKAAELASAELAQRMSQLRELRDLFERGLAELTGVKVFAQHAERLPNTVQFGVEGVDGEMLLMQLDQKGFAVSSGSACASAGKQPSPVLLAMGVGDEEAKTAIRVSFGVSNSDTEVMQFINVLKILLNQA